MSKLSNDDLRAKALASLAAMTDAEKAEIQRGIDSDPDSPELTDRDFARMRPADDELVSLAKRARGQRGPGKAPKKQQINVRLDPDVLDRLRATGPGWQSRINVAVREYLAKERA